jgi:hypothetical protein
MTPRALTWLHLLPGDCSFDCRSGAAWVCDALRERGARDGRKIVFAYGPTELPGSLDGAHGFVGINCPAATDQALRRAGLNHIQRLAILPGLDNARWFIPLASPAISSAAFDLYTPARTAARLKRLAARMAAHLRLPVWYRDQVCIAQRQPPPLETAMRNLFPGAPVHIALSSGAPGDARNRKISAAVIDSGGRIAAFLKIAQSDLCRELLRNEAAVLRKLPALLGEGNCLAPRLLFAREVDGTMVAAQTPLPGRTISRWGEPHVAFLKSLQTRQVCQACDSPLVQALSGQVAALAPARPELSAALGAVMPELARMSAPLTVVHGDFAPWNLRRHRGRLAAFDWEYGRPGGIPGIDQTHYVLQTGYLLENWSIETTVHRLRALDRTRGPGRAVQIVYLVDMLARLFTEGYDASNDMIAWKLQLLAKLAGARREAVLA